MEILKLEEHLDNWDLSAEDLCKNYKLNLHTHMYYYTDSDRLNGFTYVKTNKKHKVFFNNMECNAEFNYYDLDKDIPDYIKLHLIDFYKKYPNIDIIQHQDVLVEYTKNFLINNYGENYKYVEKDKYNYSYTWDFDKYYIYTYSRVDSRDDNIGGYIVIHFKEVE